MKYVRATVTNPPILQTQIDRRLVQIITRSRSFEG